MEVAPAPYRVEIAAPLADVRFPPLCARCAAPPAGKLALTKMFRHTHSESPTTYAFGAVAVPFCGDCLAAHERERRPPEPRVLRSLRNQFLLRLLPYVIPVAVIAFMIKEFLRPTLRALTKGDVTGALLYAVPVAFFALLGLMFWRLVRKAREGLIAPYSGPYRGDPDEQYVDVVRGQLGIHCIIPGPPTSTLAAVDFGDEDYQFFEANRRTFTFANAEVGERFAAENAALVWHPDSPAARRGARLRHAALVVVAVVVVAVVVYKLIASV